MNDVFEIDHTAFSGIRLQFVFWKKIGEKGYRTRRVEKRAANSQALFYLQHSFLCELHKVC